MDCSHASPNSRLTKHEKSSQRLGQDFTELQRSNHSATRRRFTNQITKTKVGIGLHSDQLISFCGIVSLRKSLVVTSQAQK